MGNARGGIRLGLLAFVVLLGLVAGQFTWRYMTRANRLNDEAVELMNQGKYEAAMRKLDEAIEIDPNHFHATYHRGICRAERHQWDGSLADFDRAVELRPKEPRAQFNRGKLLWTLGRFEEAQRSLERAADLDHEDAETWLLIGECAYEQFLRAKAKGQEPAKGPAEATSALKNYLRLRPGAPDRRTVEQKLEILAHIEKYPEVLERRAPPPAEPEADLVP